MPFTFSHPAIILPFGHLPRRWISLTGLVIGSMVPDFEYFIRMKVESIYSHTWPGLLLVDLPLGLFLMLVYDILVKDPLIDHLPVGLNRRLSGFKGIYKRSYAQYLIVASISILIGAASHIAWDGFTHPHGYFVGLIPQLYDKVQLAGYQFFVYKVLQHTSTIVGALVIATTVYLLPVAARITRPPTIRYWICVFLVIAAVVAMRSLSGLAINEVGNWVVTGIAGGFLGLIVASMIYHKRKS